MEEGREEHAWSNIIKKSMLTLLKYARKAERNTGLIGEFKGHRKGLA